MNVARFSARLAQRGRSLAVTRTTRRRIALLSVALAAVPASLALTMSPAHAATSTCLDANAQQVYDFGAIVQWDCSATDPYQQWTPMAAPVNPNLPPPLGQLVELQNVGALDNNNAADCLDADAQQVYDGGAIIQWGCNPGDTYQQWMMIQTSAGYLFENYGAYLNGAADCLDADAQQVYDNGAVIQYGCNEADPFQQWKPVFGGSFLLLESVGSL
jgi:hypothetical protein